MALLNKKFSKQNTIIVGLADLGPPAIVSTFPVKSPADLKGKKVRVFTEGLADEIRAFGGPPVKLPFSEVYTAMQYGNIQEPDIGRASSRGRDISYARIRWGAQ